MEMLQIAFYSNLSLLETLYKISIKAKIKKSYIILLGEIFMCHV